MNAAFLRDARQRGRAPHSIVPARSGSSHSISRPRALLRRRVLRIGAVKPQVDLAVPRSAHGTASRPPLLVALRSRTATQHQRLDASLDMAHALTVHRYDTFLRASLAVVEVLEPIVERVLGGFDGPTRRARLSDDLQVVASRRTAPTHAAPDAAPLEVRCPSTVAEAFGCAYVLEGSTLGGLVLARTVEPALDLRAGEGTSYLRLRGERTGEQWRAFLARLEHFGSHASPLDREAACELAGATFDAYSTAFAAGEVVVR